MLVLELDIQTFITSLVKLEACKRKRNIDCNIINEVSLARTKIYDVGDTTLKLMNFQANAVYCNKFPLPIHLF